MSPNSELEIYESRKFTVHPHQENEKNGKNVKSPTYRQRTLSQFFTERKLEIYRFGNVQENNQSEPNHDLCHGESASNKKLKVAKIQGVSQKSERIGNRVCPEKQPANVDHEKHEADVHHVEKQGQFLDKRKFIKGVSPFFCQDFENL